MSGPGHESESVTQWSCGNCGPHRDSRPNWCEAGCGRDHGGMTLVDEPRDKATEADHFRDAVVYLFEPPWEAYRRWKDAGDDAAAKALDDWFTAVERVRSYLSERCGLCGDRAYRCGGWDEHVDKLAKAAEVERPDPTIVRRERLL